MDVRSGTFQETSAAEVSHLQVSDGGRVAATATVESPADPHGTATVSLHSQRDVVAPHARTELVDQVLDQPGVRRADHVHVVVAVGDAESIGRLQQRTAGYHARAAGSSSVIDAEIVPRAE
jgi:hypothetical protein